MRIFCRKIFVNDPAVLRLKGPLLLACNHPNSFLDGILLDILFEQPAWALARGDVFKKPFYTRLLTAMKLLPVYRSSEGPEHLGENYKTFDACQAIFRQHGIVQIFSEGKCINEWHLRALKKGTARLAISSWEQGIPLKVIPVGINYSAFRRFGKNLFINFGEAISKSDVQVELPDGLRYLEFNRLLNKQLEQLVFEIDKADLAKQKKLLYVQPQKFERFLFALPAAIGYLVHAPFYIPVKRFVWKRCHHNDHYDSVLAAILLVFYPVYLLFLAFVLYLLFRNAWVFSILIFFPFSAWSYSLLKTQLDHIDRQPQ